MSIKIKDREELIGLFYIISGSIYSYIESIKDREVDSQNEIQPLYNHEYLLDILKHREDIFDKVGYKLKKANYSTFPRGRVFYDFLKQRFYCQSDSRIYFKCEELIKREFDNNNLIFKSEIEYSYYDEEYL